MLGAWTVRAPIPTDYTGARGLAVAASTTYVYECAADTLRAASRAAVSTTLTNDVVALEVNEREHATTGYIDVDNSAGVYAPGVAPLAVGNLITVSLGYRTASGVRTSTLPDLTIYGYEHRRAGGESLLRLLVEGGWEQLKRNRQRTQIVHSGDTYATILTRAFSRAGLTLTQTTPSSRATSVTPKFTIHPQTSGYEAVAEALAFLTDRISMSVLAGAVIREPLAGDAIDATRTASTTASTSCASRRCPSPVVEAHAFGAGAFGESIDYVAAAQLGGTREQLRDTTSTTGATAAATAVARLRRRAMDIDRGHLIAPPNVGTELYDVVDVTDAPLGLSAETARVRGIAWRYLPLRGVYEHRLELMPL